MARYQIFDNGKDKVIVVSTYAGKPVRGVAKCAPNDEFNISRGSDLAAIRCDMKIAQKRLKRAKEKYNEAVEALNEAQKWSDRMEDYLRCSIKEVEKLQEKYDAIMEICRES